MRSTGEVIQILAKARPELARRYGIRRLSLFGSFARGEQREDSDVDILVDVDASIGLRFVELANQLEELLGLRADLVSRRAITARHWKFIEPELLDVQ
jgi:predicted nucleotidyltransferase